MPKRKEREWDTFLDYLDAEVYRVLPETDVNNFCEAFSATLARQGELILDFFRPRIDVVESENLRNRLEDLRLLFEDNLIESQSQLLKLKQTEIVYKKARFDLE